LLIHLKDEGVFCEVCGRITKLYNFWLWKPLCSIKCEEEELDRLHNEVIREMDDEN
jgi:hypothetical protein